MTIRQVGDGLLRCRDTPILSFLAPSVKARTAWSRRQALQRSFTASANFHDDPDRRPLQTSDFNFARSVENNRKIGDMLDETFKGAISKRPSQSKGPSSSADLVQDSFQADIHRPEDESRSSREGRILSSMYFPGQKPGEAPRSVAAMRSAIKPRNTATIRSRPSLGRTVDVSAAGVARAFQVLAYELRDNKIREDQKMQRFHERPGLKRKRLKSERWRRRFKFAFKATLQKVHEMRKKGW